MTRNEIELRTGPGGQSAFIAGTRVRVSDIARLHDVLQTEMIAERIQAALPHLTLPQITAALGYWRANKARIVQEIEEEEKLLDSIPTKM